MKNTWTCYCGKENEVTNKNCLDCKAEKPIYKGIVINKDLRNLTIDQKTELYFKLSHLLLIQAKNNLESDEDAGEIILACDKASNVIEKLNPVAKGKKYLVDDGEEDVELTYDYLNAELYYLYGRAFYRNVDYRRALAFFKKSISYQVTQKCLFYIANAISRSDVEEAKTGFFKGSEKVQTAWDHKKQIEINLFRKVIEMDPKSTFAYLSAELLLEKHSFIDL